MLKKNEKGFALVLSLILLMVMSLMGGSLVVISSSDHRSNNNSDIYQQAFYVAEHALLEAEKDIINQYMGSWTVTQTTEGVITLSKNEATKGNAPKNETKAKNNTACYKSFKNINKQLDVVKHNTAINFYTLISSIFDSTDANLYPGDGGTEDEEDYLARFTYEYFFLNIGKAEYKESGSSVKKTSVDFEQSGTAYKIYACGMYDDDDIIIPLESVIVLPG